MAIVREQYKVAEGSGSESGTNVTFDTSVTAGSLLLMVLSVYQAGGTVAYTISDNNSNSWTELYDVNYDGTDLSGMAYAYNANSGSTTVTITTGGADDYFTIVIVEVSGIKTTAALDQNNNADTSGSSWDSGNITTTENDEYLIGVLAHDNGNRTLTEDAAFTLVYEQQNGATDMPISVGERIVSSTLTESYSGTIAVSSQYFAAIASFEGIPAAGGLDIPIAMYHYTKHLQ